MKGKAKVLAASLCFCLVAAACRAGPPADVGDALAGMTPRQLELVWADGLGWPAYLASLGEEAEVWRQAYEVVALGEDLESRAMVLAGMHRVLALVPAECVGCPGWLAPLAVLADTVPGVQLRLMGPERAGAVADLRPEAYPAAAGEAVPVLVVLDDGFRSLGWWSPGPEDRGLAPARAADRVLDRVVSLMERRPRD